MTAALLQTKLYLPIPRPDRVPRPRLTEALDAVLQPGGKVVLVSAPAGSGKTTLVAAWLQEQGQPDVSSPNSVPIFEPCWLSLDEGDNDLARFLVYLVAALERVAPGLGEGALSLLRGPQQPPAESFMTALINDILALTQEEAAPGRILVLVLDDYHLIHSQDVHQIVTFLLDHLPEKMRLVLVSRTEPPLPLARLRGRGHLVTLDGGDLRFTDEEARLFLNRVMGLDLSQDEAAALATRTEGWIAGLQMAALALGAQRPAEQIASGRPAKAGTDQVAGTRFIMDYLLQEVLQSQPADLQTFLLHTAILDRLNGPLCDAVTGREDSQATLVELERRNLFLFPMDQEERWYRYHHLFSELLRRRLDQTEPEALTGLHQRASAWYRANGFMSEAIGHALAAGNEEEAADLVAAAADPALMGGQFQTVLDWLRQLPDGAVQRRPRLGFYQAFLMVLDSRPMAEIEVILRAAEEAATGDSVNGDAAPAKAEAMLIRAVLAMLTGDLQTGADLSQRAMALLPEDAPFLHSLALRNLASVYSMTGEVAAAGEALTEAVTMAENTGDKTSHVLTLYSLARVCILQGRLYAAREYNERALSVGRDRRGRPLPIVARVLTSLADIKREWNELNEAGRLAKDGIELTKQGFAFWGIGGFIVLALVRQAEGEVVAAQAAMDAARELAIRFDATDLDDRSVELFQARIWLAQGDVEATGRWAARLKDGGAGVTPRSRQQGQIAGWYVVHESEQIHLARLRLAQGRPEAARRLLAGLRPPAASHGRTGTVIAIDLLLALTWQAMGDLAHALDTLEGTMALAEPEGYIRIFLDEGPAMAALLRQIPPDSAVAAYARRLLAAFEPAETKVGARSEIVDVAGQALPDPISEREMDVLRLLPSHLTSTEIAAELNISPNTARFHIKNIYSKLNAHNRAEAVAQARQLNLLK
ncbi:MAG: AAA family ATPase [Chloroflexota bacterium]|nr:MAG: AAA family ATPase [Chloroflexota bacterium]